MKSRFRKCVAVMVVGILLANTVTVYAESNEAPVYDVSTEIEERLTEISQDIASAMEEAIKAEAPAKQQYYNLLDKLESASNTRARGVEYDLEQYYGGAYINDDKKLTICCTTDDAKIVSAFKGAAGSDEVIISLSKYNLDELNKMKEEFMELLNTYKADKNLDANAVKLIEDIDGFGIDVFTNQIRVSIYELDTNKEKLFSELFDIFPENIVRVEEAYETITTVELRPGRQLYLTALDSWYGGVGNQSVGYRGYRIDALGNRVDGFTTCGHAQPNYLYRGGEKVGTLYDYRNGGNYDISFYDVEPGVTLSNTTAYSNDTGSTEEVVELSVYTVPNSAVVVGEVIMKVGGTSFYTQGRILETSCSWKNNFYTNALKTDALNLGGDSGGVAFIYYNGSFRIVGTMSGSGYDGTVLSPSTFTYSLVAQYKYAYNALNSVIYRY